IYRDTALDGSPLEPPPVAEEVKAGICPDCTRTEYRELCDYDVREPEVIAPPDRIFEGQELTGTFADGNDWLIPQISSKGVAGTYTYYSDRAVDLSFGVAVDVEITLFHREFWDNMATISPPVRVIAGAGSYDSITGILTAPPNTRTTILMENITSGRITPVEGEWLFESISIYSPARRQPILFREKTVIDCEGRVTVTYIDGNADEYTVLGEIRQCP